MPRRKPILLQVGIVSCVVVVLVYFTPLWLQLAYRAGIPIVDQRGTLGVEVEMRNGWYPLAAGDSWLGQRLIPMLLGPTVVFHRPTWLDPWSPDTLWISKSTAEQLLDQKSDVYREIRSYPWGRAGVVKEGVHGVRARVLVLVPEHQLTISAAHIDVLADIGGIRSKR